MWYRNLLIKTSVGVAVIFAAVAEGREEVVTPERMLEVESQIALPPDPGPNGDALLVGYDVDGDGIRDDIQRYIEFKYWDEPKLKAVYYDFAHAKLKLLAAAEKDRDTILRHSNDILRVSKCISALNERDNTRDLNDEEKEVESRILNTFERLKASFKANAKLSGIYPGGDLPRTWIKYCEKYGFHE